MLLFGHYIKGKSRSPETVDYSEGHYLLLATFG